MPLLSQGTGTAPALLQRSRAELGHGWISLCDHALGAWGIECPFCAGTINLCRTGKCRSLTDAAKICSGKVLVENISPKKDLVTRFACDSPCVILDDILCDFCFDIFPPGFMGAI